MKNKIKNISLIILFFCISFFLGIKVKSFILLLTSILIFSFIFLFIKRLNKNLLLIYFSILTTILFFEIVLSINFKTLLTFHKKDINEKKVIIFNDFKYETTYLGNQLKPGFYNHYKKKGNEYGFKAIYKINSKNFRENKLIKNNEDKIKKINFFGGSDIFGWGLKDEETLPYIFSKNNKEYNVFNYGIIGGAVHQSFHMIKKDNINIGDINVIVTTSYHLPRIDCNRDYSFNSPIYKLDKGKLVFDGYCIFPFLRTKFQLPKIIGSVLNRSEIIKVLRNTFSTEYSKENINLYVEILKEINNISIREKKKAVILYYGPQKDLDKEIIQLFIKNDIPFIDVSLFDKKYFIKYDKHYNKLANTVWYNRLSQFLLN